MQFQSPKWLVNFALLAGTLASLCVPVQLALSLREHQCPMESAKTSDLSDDDELQRRDVFDSGFQLV